MGKHSQGCKGAAFAVFSTLLIALLCGCGSAGVGSAADSDAVNSGSSEVAGTSAEPEPQKAMTVPEVTDAVNIEKVDVPYGTLMASDGEYLYISYISDGDECGLYRTDLSLGSPVMLDRGIFYKLCALDGKLYYAERNNAFRDPDGSSPELTYFCLDTGSLAVSGVSREEYDAAKAVVDPEDRFALPEGVRQCAVVGDSAYFIQQLGELDRSPGKNHAIVPNYVLSYCDEEGDVTQTDIMWRHNGQRGLIFAYGDYAVYSRTCIAATEPNAVDRQYEEDSGDLPCFYNTKTGVETVLVREHESVGGLQTRGTGHVCVLGASSGYLLASMSDDELRNGDFIEVESLSDPSATVLLSKVIEGAEVTEDLEQRDAEEREAERAAFSDEPYGPGTSTLYLEAPATKSACYRLVRMDESTQFQVLLEPGESVSESFPCGRYTLKVAKGDMWISDEEAFGPDGDYDTTGVFRFEEGGSYRISTGDTGDFRPDDAQGFTGGR